MSLITTIETFSDCRKRSRVVLTGSIGAHGWYSVVKSPPMRMKKGPGPDASRRVTPRDVRVGCRSLV